VGGIFVDAFAGQQPAPLWLTCVSPLVPFYTRFGFREITIFAEIPPYFRSVSRLFGLLAYLSSANSLSVMGYEDDPANEI
jgi:hypothetical protein